MCLDHLKDVWKKMELRESIDKEYHDNGPDSTKIFKVNGQQIRDTLCVDFIGGGHSLVYDFIPENEIWIEDMAHPADQKYILSHELVEHYLMKHLSYSYPKAHNIANKIEERLRANEEPETVFADFCNEYFKKPELKNSGKHLALAYYGY
jgi:hypothetical protein